MSSRHLILGAVRGYGPDKVIPFAESLARSGFHGKAVLFVSDVPDDTKAALLGRGVSIEACSLDHLIPADRPTLINILRSFLYRDYLERHGNGFDRVMLTDVRDVVFQADPFGFGSGISPDGLNLFMEDRRMTVGRCRFTAGWVERRFNREVLTRIADRPISCSGTVIGSTAGVVAYLDRMLPLLHPLDPDLPGYDQGVHNVLFHTGRLGTPRLYANETGPVLTLGHLTLREIRTNGEGVVCNAAGMIPAVVHQYDRIPALRDEIWRRYGRIQAFADTRAAD